MALHVFWIFLISCSVAAFDYYYRSLFTFSPEFFVNHDLDPKTQIFFETYGKYFRFGGLAVIWLGCVSAYFFREAENAFYLIGSFAAMLVGAILHQGEQGWMFLMKKKNK